MEIYAGYDGGGTKTACVLTDRNGKYLGFGAGGPSNYLFCGKETAAESVRRATEAAFRNAGLPVQHLKAAYMAGAAIKMQNGAAHVPFFRTCIDAELVVCESDIYPIWYGSVGTQDAVVSIAGTGALTYVCSETGLIRVGGWGPLLGDEGSGYDLGLQALRLSCRMYDGRAASDQAFQRAVFAHYQVETPGELLKKLNSGDTRSAVASVAKIVFQLYKDGNQTAEMLLEHCADEIALAVDTAVSKAETGKQYPLILSGGVVHKESPLYEMLRKRLVRPEGGICEVVSLQIHPAAAAAALALHHSGLEESAKCLMKQAKEMQR